MSEAASPIGATDRGDKTISSLVSDYFAAKDSVKLVILHGSMARGRATPSSDVDLAIAGAGPTDPAILLAIQAELSELTGRAIDLIDLWKAEGLILLRATTSGLRLKTDARLFVRFHSKALAWREDFQPIQRMLREATIKRFIDGRRDHQGQA